MKVTHELEIDLTRDAGAAALAVMEGDAYSRVVRVSLTQGRRAWAVPEDVSVVVHYQKPDGTSGVYDTMPDGSEAWSVESGRLLLCLAPQMLTAAGTVQVRVRLLRGDAVLSVFPFRLKVGQSLAEGAGSEDYINWRGAFLPQPAGARAGQWLRITEVDAEGRVVEVEAVEEPGVDDETVADAVAEYLDANPVQEADPMVPDWAKAEEKPKYTAAEVGALSASELQSATNAALAQAKASGEFDGADGAPGERGADGVSATHEWNGTILSVTSASGTSSADLKGEKGEPGADGRTPVKGEDYWTDADKTEMVAAVLAALPAWEGGSY